MPSNYKANDPYVNEQVDLDDIFCTDAWLVDQFVGGTLFTWGRNPEGRMGNGTITHYSSPIQIGSLNNWKQISSGSDLSFSAVKTDGTLWGCGTNSSGELGNGTAINYSSPIQIGSLTSWNQVSSGLRFTTAIKTDGTLWAWGRNIYGQLGNGTIAYYSSPIQIGSLNNWKQVIACGYITTAIKNDGTLWAWGRNNYGQLGNETTINYSSPIQVGSLTNWKQVFGSTAIKTDGTLWTWGYNIYGQLGNETTINYSSPIQVGSLTNWKQVSAESASNDVTIRAAIKTDGTLWTWGRNIYGQLGNGTNSYYSSPIQIGSLTTWKQVSVGGCLSIIKTDGTLWACGYNNFGALGNGTTISYSSPIQVGSLTNWKQTYSVGSASINAITFKDLG